MLRIELYQAVILAVLGPSSLPRMSFMMPSKLAARVIQVNAKLSTFGFVKTCDRTWK